MTKTVDIAIEPLTPDAFAPFGQVLGPRDDAPHFSTENVKTWDVKFEIFGKVELEYAAFNYKPDFQFNLMERHFTVTQSFFPLNNDASVTVFAPPTDPNDPTAVPDPADLRAFHMDGGQGIMMWRGTWHSGRFPVRSTGARFVFLTDAFTTDDLTAQLAGRPGRLTQLVDFEKERDLRFHLTDPQNLLA